MLVLCRINANKKLPVSLAESALLSTEESIMATFDFLSSENVVDEEAMSDGENDDGLPDDDNAEDRLTINRSTVKVISPSHTVNTGCCQFHDCCLCANVMLLLLTLSIGL